jgi:hypothetical protein
MVPDTLAEVAGALALSASLGSEFFDQDREGFTQLEPVAGGV